MSKVCSKCNKINDDNTVFCVSCGSKLSMNNTTTSTTRNTQTTQTSYGGSTGGTSIPEKFRDIVVEPTEKLKGELSNSVATTFASGGGFGTSKIFFTNKRFYAKVNNFNIKNGITTNNIIVPLERMSGSKIVHKNPIIWLILAGLTLLVAIISSMPQVLIATLVFTILFFLQRGTFLEVSYPGKTEEVKVSMYSYNSVNEFQKQLTLEINK